MRYVPTPIPNDCPPALKAWLATELRRIAADLLSHTPTSLTLQPVGVEPVKRANGMIVYAVNPWAAADFSGVEGFYGYEDGAWVKL